jgi:hypothetical protein
MPIEPPEIPPPTPGQPTEPPREDPPGNPNPEIPPPVREPGTPAQPQELPGKMPDEIPGHGPGSPATPNPATDRAGTILADGLKQSPECAMNAGVFARLPWRNKSGSAFDACHNPASRLFVHRQTLNRKP